MVRGAAISMTPFVGTVADVAQTANVCPAIGR
jgi:hypothetical protein